MSVIKVRVPCTWVATMGDATKRADLHGIADFHLGEGPCGKTVERLDVHYHAWGVEVVQVCTCTEQKNFVYPWHTVTGRVEVTHG